MVLPVFLFDNDSFLTDFYQPRQELEAKRRNLVIRIL